MVAVISAMDKSMAILIIPLFTGSSIDLEIVDLRLG